MTQKFVLLSTAVMLVLPFALGGWATDAMVRYVMSKNASSAASYMDIFLQPYVQSFETNGAISEEDFRMLDQFSQHPELRTHVLSIKVWGPDGTILYATNTDLIGQKFATDEIEAPMKGEVLAFLDQLDAAENQFERGLGVPIYEVYVPLRSETTGQVIAVGEFYEDATTLHSELREAAWRSWLVALLLSLLLLAPLYVLMRRGARTIEAQGQAMTKMEREIDTSHIKIEAERVHLEDLNAMIRKRIGLALHDGPSQLVTYILMSLDELGSIVEDSDTGKQPDPENRIATIRKAASEALEELRGISKELFSLPIDDARATSVPISELVDRFREKSETPIDTSGLDLADGLPEPVRMAAGRIVSEALNNSIKHARGARRWVGAKTSPDEFVLEIKDDGPGFPSTSILNERAARGHLGLAGMEFQARSIGGTFSWSSGPDQLTIVRLTVPGTIAYPDVA